MYTIAIVPGGPVMEWSGKLSSVEKVIEQQYSNTVLQQNNTTEYNRITVIQQLRAEE